VSRLGNGAAAGRIRSLAVVRRVSIQGISGSGKTTLGRTLAERLALPYVETDALVHGPGWTETPDAELRAALEPVVTGEGWVIDNDYRRKIGTYVLEHADTLVWLDLPLHVCMGRLWRRTSGRIRRREELWNGNRESWRGAFWGRESLFVWALRKHVSQRRTMLELLARPELAHLRVVRLRSPAAVESWLRVAVDGAADNGAQRG
jgi:adenylate kinase family enzyme